MPLLVPNPSETTMLEAILNKVAPQNLVLRLFTNNVTPGESDLAATYTEAAGNGYAAQTLTAASWTVVEGAPTEATHPEVTFSFTGALGNVYGYYVTQAGSGKLMWAERFTGAPFNIANNGDQIRVTPKLTLE